MSISGRLATLAAPSLFDRLLDAEPDRPQDRLRTASETVSDLRAAVHRDVEALLNARRPWRSAGELWPLLRRSPIGFGISDFTGGALNDPNEREALRLEIEMAICRFEPRLTEVRVQVAGDLSALRATLVLRIDAMLLMHPQPEPISFDTMVDATTADVTLRPLQDS